MNTTVMFWQIINFLALPFFLALSLTGVGAFRVKKSAYRLWLLQWLVLFVSGVVVMVGGVLVTRVDGKLWTYVVLIVVCAVLQTWFLRKHR